MMDPVEAAGVFSHLANILSGTTDQFMPSADDPEFIQYLQSCSSVGRDKEIQSSGLCKLPAPLCHVEVDLKIRKNYWFDPFERTNLIANCKIQRL